MEDNKIRLQKIIADLGIASRRKAEEIIKDGGVTVNGRRANLGDKADPYKDKIVVAGRELKPVKNAKKYYIMLHKPRGFITTMNDEGGRKCVAELVEDVDARVFPVGRLDRDSEGLLLMTNDGDFANMISHPSTHFPKTYRVTVHPRITEEQLTKLTTGVVIDGRMSMPASVRVVASAIANGTLRLCASVRARRVLPLPVGPMRSTFDFSIFTASSAACALADTDILL